MPHDEIISEIRNAALTDPAMYGDSFADVYDEWYGTLGDTDFVTAVARRLPGRPQAVLELGVGTGRLARLLRGARGPVVDTMTGIDASQAMLARAHGAGVSAFVKLVQGDFSCDLPDGPFDMVFVGYNTLFNLPSTDAVAQCLSLVSQVLGPGGVFMVDAVIPRGSSRDEHVETRTMANGDVVTSVSRHDPQTQTVTGYFSHIADGQDAGMQGSTVRRWSVHYLHPDELDRLADAAGLGLESRWADGEAAPFLPESSRHVSTYVKR